MTWMQIMLPLLLSAFTGWVVVWALLKLVFRPRKPFKVAGFKIQGILPANQQLIAEKTASFVKTEFLSFASLEEKITDPKNFNKLKPEIEAHIDSFLRERLKETFPMLSMLIGDKTINQLKTAFLLELETLFPILMKSYVNNLAKDLDLEKLVTEKIAGLSLIKLEETIYQSANKQLIKIQILGAVIGTITGLLHIFVNMQLYR